MIADSPEMRQARIRKLRDEFGEQVSQYTDAELYQTWNEWFISEDANQSNATYLQWLRDDWGK